MRHKRDVITSYSIHYTKLYDAAISDGIGDQVLKSASKQVPIPLDHKGAKFRCDTAGHIGLFKTRYEFFRELSQEGDHIQFLHIV